MTTYFVDETDLKKVANALRNNSSTSEPISFPDGFVTKINNSKRVLYFEELGYTAIVEGYNKKIDRVMGHTHGGSSEIYTKDWYYFRFSNVPTVEELNKAAYSVTSAGKDYSSTQRGYAVTSFKISKNMKDFLLLKARSKSESSSALSFNANGFEVSVFKEGNTVYYWEDSALLNKNQLGNLNRAEKISMCSIDDNAYLIQGIDENKYKPVQFY